VLAVNEFRSLQRSDWTTVTVTAAAVTMDDELVYGQLAQGLPVWHKHWDGEPPRAVLVDASSGEIVAPPLLAEQSLATNGSGVLWKRDECRFVLSQSLWNRGDAHPLLRCEVVRSSATFYGSCGIALLAALLAILCRQIHRVALTEIAQRQSAIAAELRVSCFVLLSLFTASAFYPGLPISKRNSDATNIHGFAAGRQASQELALDPLLGDPRNFAWYTPAYVEFVRWWGAAGFHYGTSCAFLAFVCTLAALFGYERLFRAASGSHAFAWLGAVALWYMKAYYPPNEVWCAVHFVPRTVFSGFLPWVVLAALAVRERPARWTLAAAASAALFYVHPVSSPALTGAILMGLVIAGDGSFWKRLGWGVLAGGVAILVMLPYVLVYAGKYVGTVEADAALMAETVAMVRKRFALGYLDLDIFAHQMGVFLASHPQYWLALVGAAWLAKKHRGEWTTRLLFGTALGYAIVVFAIPIVDLSLARAWGRLPFQVDLVRGVRYLDIFVLAAMGLVLRELPAFGSELVARCRAALVSFEFGALWHWARGAKFQAATVLLLAFYFATAGETFARLGKMTGENWDLMTGPAPSELVPGWELVRVLQTVRQPDELVSGPMYLRSLHIPVASSWKDLGALAYSNPRQLVETQARLSGVRKEMVWPVTVARVREIASKLDARVVVLNRGLAARDVAEGPETVFQNEKYLVVRVPHAAPVLSRPADSAPVTESPPMASRPTKEHH